ncbi:tetratricopeptide repeat protein, partial [Ancylostoma duodenale]
LTIFTGGKDKSALESCLLRSWQVASKKNPAKARSCLERAVKIRPNNQEYVRELDDVYEESEESADQRLELLSRLNGYNKPMWLRRRLVKLAKLKKDWDVVIDELQQIIRYDQNDVASWADLAEAYSHRGNLQSSVNAYGKLLEIDPASDYAICVHLRLFDKAVDEERFEHLKVVFKLAGTVVSERPRISLAYKLAADSLLRVIKFRDDIMMDVGIPKSWSVSDRLSALRTAVMFYSVALELNRENGWAWSDLAVSLLHQARLENLAQHALKASDCLRKAMSLFECAQARSYVWTLIAEAERLSAIGEGVNKDAADSAALQQHYLVRALQLNKANDEAWLRLALLYYSNGAMDLAHLAIEEALKHNPLLAEAWCAYAMKADSEGAYHEAIDMFRHSVSIKPIAAAVMKYTAMLCQTLRTKSFDPATVMIDFSKVLKLRDEKDCVAKNVLLHIGILAELFGHYEDAVKCISESGQNGLHLQRARMKAGEKIQNPGKPLETLAKLCATPTEDLFNLLKEKQPLYKNVFDRLGAPDAEGLQELYNAYSKSISVPLVVAAVIRFGIPLCDQAVSVLHDVLPRHELIDVFPTIMPEEMDNGLKYVEQDGEEPFRYSHFIAKPLWEVLKKRREQLEAETNGEVVQTV